MRNAGREQHTAVCRAALDKKCAGRGRARDLSAVIAAVVLVLSFIAAAVFIFDISVGLESGGTGSQTFSAEVKLPVLKCPDPVYYAANDPVTASADAAVRQAYARLRSDRGLTPAAVSDGLNKAALYGATLGVCGDQSANGATAAAAVDAEKLVSAAYKNLPGIDGFVLLRASDYSCTDSERAAEFMLRSVLNTYSGERKLTGGAILAFGAAAAVRDTGAGLEYCAVICYANSVPSDAAEKQLSSVIPGVPCGSAEEGVAAALSASGNATSTSGNAATGTSGNAATGTSGNATESTSGNPTMIFVAKGSPLTAPLICGQIDARGLRGQTPSVRWDAAAVDTSATGTVAVNMSFTFGGAIAGASLNVNVTDPVRPYFSGETVTLPEIPEGELWNIAAYAPVSDQTGIDAVICSPLCFGTSDIVPDAPPGVTVFARNSTGILSSATVKTSLSATEYESVRPDYTDGKGLNVNTPAGTKLTSGGHALIRWTGREKTAQAGWTPKEGYVVFTLTSADGRTVSVRRPGGTLVWDVAKAGTVQIAAAGYSGEGKLIETALIKINVAEGQEIVYNDPELGFPAGINVRDAENGLRIIVGIRAGTTAGELSAALKVTGGSAPAIMIENKSGAAIVADGILATGSTVKLSDNGKIIAAYTVIIKGDVNGDGAVGIGDFAKLRQHLLRGGVISGADFYAADLNDDGTTGIADFAKLRQFLLGRISLD